MYDSIIIDVRYFQPGDFWNIVASGFATNPHDETDSRQDEIDAETETDRESAIELAEYWRDFYLFDKSKNITIHLEGNEYVSSAK